MSEPITLTADPIATDPIPVPPLSPPPTKGREMPTWVAVILCACLIELGFILWAQFRFGSYRYALAYIQGARLQVRPGAKSVGTHRQGDVLETSVTIRNHGASPARIVGARSGCGCIASRGLPMTVPPGGSATFLVTVRFGSTVGEWHQTIEYLTDVVADSPQRVDLVGQVVGQ